MCQHCCRMESTPCPTIPYACPLCPIRRVADRCDGTADRRQLYRNPAQNPSPKQTELCKEISELYCFVVESKRKLAGRTRRRSNWSLQDAPSNAPVQQRIQIRSMLAAEPRRANQLDCGIPVPCVERIPDKNTWTWTSRYPMSQNVLPVRARMAEPAPRLTGHMRPERSVSRILPTRRQPNLYRSNVW